MNKAVYLDYLPVSYKHYFDDNLTKTITKQPQMIDLLKIVPNAADILCVLRSLIYSVLYHR